MASNSPISCSRLFFQNMSNHNLTALWLSIVIISNINLHIRIKHILHPDKIVFLKSVNNNVSFILKISMSLVFCTVAVFPLKSTHQKRHVQPPAALLFSTIRIYSLKLTPSKYIQRSIHHQWWLKLPVSIPVVLNEL